MKTYWRPIPIGDIADIPNSLSLAGGPVRFVQVERLRRGEDPEVLLASQVPEAVLATLSAPRPDICGMRMDAPKIMAVINATPDSFSDGGDFKTKQAALTAAIGFAEDADIIDIGGESTRPGAEFVPATEEIARTGPVIAAIRAAGVTTPISIDTRKADVARAAVDAGASLFNDVSALSYDEGSLGAARELGVPVCLMHASGDPKTMQKDPQYDDVLLDVYDYLESRVEAAVAAGVRREALIVDPGIGFGKTQAHNLALLHRLSLFHGLGCPILLGVSRKRFIGTIGQQDDPKLRFPGSCAVALDGLRQGAQILRVHDVGETKQAVRLFEALHCR